MSLLQQHNEKLHTATSKTGVVSSIVQEDAGVERGTTTSGSKHLYITGLRGCLVIESFIWVYFKTFIPAVVPASANQEQISGPAYQTVIRAVLSVPFWNDSFIYNFFILLSMRTIAVSYLEKPTGQTYGASVIRRIVRMVILLSAASGMATLIFSQTGTEFVKDFIAELPNSSIEAPIKTYNGLSAVNSLFNLFWLTDNFYTQAAVSFWPTKTLWVPSVIYYQSWTVYFLMVFLPFTRPKWHVQGLALFALGSFWMESWGWYSATGLFFADLAINTTLNHSFKRGIKISEDSRLPYWLLAMAFAAVGIAMKYAFTVLPQYKDSELVLHPFLDLAESYSPSTAVMAGPYARIDDWLLVVAIFIATEYFETVQRVLSFKPLLWLGDRSFGFFTAQCIIFWTAGTKLWLVLHENAQLSTASANTVVLIMGIAAVVVFAELFHRLVDVPSRLIAKASYIWLVT